MFPSSSDLLINCGGQFEWLCLVFHNGKGTYYVTDFLHWHKFKHEYFGFFTRKVGHMNFFYQYRQILQV